MNQLVSNNQLNLRVNAFSDSSSQISYDSDLTDESSHKSLNLGSVDGRSTKDQDLLPVPIRFNTGGEKQNKL